MNEEEIKNKLSEEEYEVLRMKGTEAPFTGKYVDENSAGIYKCKVCGQVLFDHTAKMNSHEGPVGLQGWPSFSEAVPGSIEYRPDDSHGMQRTEVVCSNCKSHLGHLFDDDHSATGKHLCINSVCLDLEKKDEKTN